MKLVPGEQMIAADQRHVLLTLSSLFCQLSSLFTIRSMQWDSVARIPAVVALNVMASPLKSMPLTPFGLEDWNTARDEQRGKTKAEVKMWRYTSNLIGTTICYRNRSLSGCTHIFLCCRCCCAETLLLSECWGSRLHHPPRLERGEKKECVR